MNRIICKDALAALRELPDGCVNLCVTSPPYYGLRDYGVDGQIGTEESPQAYICRLVEVFREVRRVLTDDGTLWLNIADSYAGSGKGIWKGATEKTDCKNNYRADTTAAIHGMPVVWDGIKAKDLIGIPWMLAFALRADGWYLRSDIIWNKTNGLPENVKDRPTNPTNISSCLRNLRGITTMPKPLRNRYSLAVLQDTKEGVPTTPNIKVSTAISQSTKNGNAVRNARS